MQQQENAAIWGAVGGALIGLSELRKGLDRDADLASQRSKDATGMSRAALTGLATFLASGFALRGLDHRVADFVLGQAFPGSPAAESPSAFISPVQSVPRPVMTEAMAAAPQQWPPSSNAYDDKGLLIHPSEGLTGQNVATGLVLGYAEARAFLLGLPGSSHPSSYILAQYFRCSRGLGAALAAIGGGSAPLTTEEYAKAFARLFRPTIAPGSGYAAGLISAAVADGAAYGNSTTETTMATVTIPKGLLAVGESAEVSFGEVALGSANLTTRIRLDSSAGTVLHQKTNAVSTAGTLRQNLNITRRADSPAGEVYEVISESDAAVTDSITFGPDTEHTLYVTGTWSAAAVGNTATAKLAQLRKL